MHYPYFEPFFLTLPLRKIAPSVVTVHDLILLVLPEHFPAGIKGRLKWSIQRMSLRGARATITDSGSSKRDIMKFVGIEGKKIHVVYLAPGEEFRKLQNGDWKLEIKQKYELPDIFVLYVGDATWNKNLPRLIEAVKMIDIPLVMVGKALVEKDFDKDNPWNQDLIKVQKMAEKDEKIVRLGFIPQEDLVALYNLATVFVMPSIYEGFGLPVLEAMACGLPVVTANTSSLPEICGEAAIFVDPYDVQNIASAIEKIIIYHTTEYEKYEEMRQKGFSQVKKFSWEKTAEETVKIYKKTIIV